MDRKQRIFAGLLWGVLGVGILGVTLAAFIQRRPATTPPHELFKPADLAGVDQDGRAFDTSELRGHPWVADFVFTTCPDQCPLMSRQMADVQKKTPAGVKLVSFTVDPQHDTPDVLKTYATVLRADPSRWHFLTGTPDQMARAAREMKIGVKPAEPNDPISHSEKFLLVDARGGVVGLYNGTNPDDVRRLIADATALAAGGGS